MSSFIQLDRPKNLVFGCKCERNTSISWSEWRSNVIIWYDM